MIQELIQEIIYNKTSLNEALTKAKVIAYRIKNDEFKIWLENELNGYPDKLNIPKYREVACTPKALLEGMFHDRYESRINPPAGISHDFFKEPVLFSISTIEQGVKEAEEDNDEFLFIPYISEFTDMISKFYPIPDNNIIVETGADVRVSSMRNIIEITKQKLLDTLLKLDEAFPDFDSAYSNNQENAKVASTIITNNIYGGNSPINVGVGNNIQQHSSTTVTTETINHTINELAKHGVDESSIEELKQIFAQKPDRQTISQKALGWIGKMGTKAIEKGIEMNLPKIIEEVNKVVEMYVNQPNN
jgi:hypothetical protein